MKKTILRFLLSVALLLTMGAISTVNAEGPLPLPSCYPGEVGCPK